MPSSVSPMALFGRRPQGAWGGRWGEADGGEEKEPLQSDQCGQPGSVWSLRGTGRFTLVGFHLGPLPTSPHVTGGGPLPGTVTPAIPGPPLCEPAEPLPIGEKAPVGGRCFLGAGRTPTTVLRPCAELGRHVPTSPAGCCPPPSGRCWPHSLATWEIPEKPRAVPPTAHTSAEGSYDSTGEVSLRGSGSP